MRVKGVAESDKESFLHPTAPALLFSKPLSSPPTISLPSFACAFHLLPGGTPQQQSPNHRFPHAIPTTHRQNQNRRFLQRPPLPPGKTKFPSLFNPATNRIKNLPVKCRYFGFGFTPQSNDYKIVGISTLVKDVPANLDHDRVGRAHVYSLNSGSSKEIDAVKLQPFCSFSTPVAITGNVFWLAKKGYDRKSDYVVSFDIEREFFTLLNGPPSPTGSHSYSKNLLAVCNDKLAMFHHYFRGILEPYSFDLWVLEGSDNRDVVGECWVKMHSVGPFSRFLYPLSIWRDEGVCMEAVCEEVIRFAGGKKVVSLFNPFTYESKNLLAHRTTVSMSPLLMQKVLFNFDNVNSPLCSLGGTWFLLVNKETIMLFFSINAFSIIHAMILLMQL
ncbi:hypothetical protein Fmac_023822 [Flemingia macrophylla]|uniref:F-box associated beta-propeller type 1 domain-containing protein n=1 Tax=Flemingia macrophylla TaxID=520843 RepID=A0ABD1LML6_9FABA